MATPESASPSPPPAEAAVKLIWLVLLMTHLMYIGLIYFLHPPTQEATPMVPAVTAAAILAGAGALIVYGVVLGEAQIEKWVAALKEKGLTGPELEAQAMARAQSMSIVCWALAESVTIMGLVLAFTGQQPFNRFLLFVVSGVAIHLYCRPKLTELREFIKSRG